MCVSVYSYTLASQCIDALIETLRTRPSKNHVAKSRIPRFFFYFIFFFLFLCNHARQHYDSPWAFPVLIYLVHMRLSDFFCILFIAGFQGFYNYEAMFCRTYLFSLTTIQCLDPCIHELFCSIIYITNILIKLQSNKYSLNQSLNRRLFNKVVQTKNDIMNTLKKGHRAVLGYIYILRERRRATQLIISKDSFYDGTLQLHNYISRPSCIAAHKAHILR